MTKEEILYYSENYEEGQAYCTDRGHIVVDIDDAYKKMDEWAEIQAIAFLDWRDEKYNLTDRGYTSKFNDGSHGKSHITPTFYTTQQLYHLFKNKK